MKPAAFYMLPEFVAVVEEVNEMSDNKSVKLAFDCAGGDFERAGEASSKIKKMLQRLGIPADCVRRIAIGTYEAEMNVIIHAGGGNVAAEVFPTMTVITVTDKGPGIPDINKALQEGWSTAPDNVRSLGFGAGMGLPNMKKYSDKMSIESEVGKGTRVTLEFLLN